MNSKSAPRRRHSPALRARVLAECAVPGASVAAVAHAHGLNANLVHKWRRGPRTTKLATVQRSPGVDERPSDAFVALQLPGTRTPATAADIRIELRRGTSTITVSWPLQGSRDCAAWLREWLR